jgi:sulfur carrier protein
MNMILNGERITLDSEITVSGIIAKYSLKEETTVAEVNGVIIKREDFKTTRLKEGDKVELVRFVGGG